MSTVALRLRRLDLADVLLGDAAAIADDQALTRRGAAPDQAIRAAVRATLDDVRARGELAAIDTMLSAVIAARGRKYLMMNAPSSKLPELERLLPALESPTIIPLAHTGMIAIHSVVGADEVWGLLPRLKTAGASGILVLPIEKIVP